MKESDKKVKELWDIVSKKKQEIQKAEKPNWVTNCSFSYSGANSPHNSFNIQTIVDAKEFVRALAFLYTESDNYTKAATELGVKNLKFSWQGYSLEDWKTDFLTRINKVRIADKKKELALLESRLDALLSPELKMELELADIQKSLSEE